ncbi:hypothetical protein Tco_0404369, partial [Tanacetum coccineum]
MSEEDQNVEVVLPVKSDMHSYSSTMTAKDVKALAFKHNIPLDLHPVALTAEWTMDKLTDDYKSITILPIVGYYNTIHSSILTHLRYNPYHNRDYNGNM